MAPSASDVASMRIMLPGCSEPGAQHCVQSPFFVFAHSVARASLTGKTRKAQIIFFGRVPLPKARVPKSLHDAQCAHIQKSRGQGSPQQPMEPQQGACVQNNEKSPLYIDKNPFEAMRYTDPATVCPCPVPWARGLVWPQAQIHGALTLPPL